MSTKNPLDEQKKLYKSYWHGLDFIRLIFICFIGFYYNYESLYNFDTYPWDSATKSLLQALGPFVFVIIALVSFMYGLKPSSSKRTRKLLLILPFGLCVLILTQGEIAFQDLYLTWDIHYFLIVGISSLYLLKKFPRCIFPFSGLGAILLCLPLWKWIPQTDLWIKDALIGHCTEGLLGNVWPIFPWIGLMWLCFGLGVWINKKGYPYLSQGRKIEFLLWPILLVLIIPQIRIYDIPAGANASCYILRQEPLIFWSNFMLFIFLLRVCFLYKVNNFLSQLWTFQNIQKLSWMRHFGLCYILHFIFIGIYQRLYYFLAPIHFTGEEKYIFLGAIYSVLLTELSVSLGTQILKKFKRQKQS